MLNLEDEGFAHAFYLLHGLSVAAMAVRVDDAARMAARATAMLGKPFVGPIGKGELEIPAVRGVSGSLVYFIDRPAARGTFFDVDFVPDPEPKEPPDLGLLRIDHVTQVVPQSELVSWVLYYKTIFGLEPAERADLSDPRGVIVSRAMTNQDRTLRIPINASQARLTAAGRFMQQTAGAGAQHIALACRDIFAAAAALSADLKLHAPENYYDDLAARFDLDDGAVARHARSLHPLRPHRLRRVLPGLYALDQRHVLRDRGAPRLRPLRRSQRCRPAGRTGRPRSPRGGTARRVRRLTQQASGAQTAKQIRGGRGQASGRERSCRSWSPAPWGMSATWSRAARPPRANA